MEEDNEHESLLPTSPSISSIEQQQQQKQQQQQQRRMEDQYSNHSSALMMSDDEILNNYEHENGNENEIENDEDENDEMESLITPLINGHNDVPLTTKATVTTTTASSSSSNTNNANKNKNNNKNSIFRSRKQQKATLGQTTSNITKHSTTTNHHHHHHSHRSGTGQRRRSPETATTPATKSIPLPFAPLRKYLCNEGSVLISPPTTGPCSYICNHDRHKEVMKSTIAFMNVLAKVLFWSSLVFLAACVVWYSFELKHNGTDPHLIAWFSAGAFVLLGFPISMYGIVMHLANYNQPNVQCYIVRILWMVPIYSLESWLCLRFHRYAIYIETLRDCYEAYVLYNFLQFLIHTLGGEEDLMLLLKDKSPTRGVHMWGLQWCVKPWLMGQPVSRGFDFTKQQKLQQQQLAIAQRQQHQQQQQQPPLSLPSSTQPQQPQEQQQTQPPLLPSSIRPIKRVQWISPFFKKCKFGVLQYVLLKVILSIAVMILELHGIYKEGDFTPKGGYLYICILTNLSQCWALYCLIFFYFATKNELGPIRPVGKFLSVKALVFFTWWQSVAISFLYQADMIPHYKDRDAENEWTSEDVAKGLQDYLICIEMFVGAIVHTFVFPHTEYLEAVVMARRQTSTTGNGATTTHGGANSQFGHGGYGGGRSPTFTKKRIGRNIMKHRMNHHQYSYSRRKGHREGGERTPWSSSSTMNRDDISYASKNSASVISTSDPQNYDLEMATTTTSASGGAGSFMETQELELQNHHQPQYPPEQQQQHTSFLKSNSNLSSVEEGSRRGGIYEDDVLSPNKDLGAVGTTTTTDREEGNRHPYDGGQAGRKADDNDVYYDDDEDLSSIDSDHGGHDYPPPPPPLTQKTGFVRALLDSTIPRDMMDNTVGIVKGDYHVEKKTLLHHAATSDQYDLFSLSSKRRAFSKLAAAAAAAQTQTTSTTTNTPPAPSVSSGGATVPTTSAAMSTNTATTTTTKRNY